MKPALAATIERRAVVHAALGEPVRLAIADHLAMADASPGELAATFELPTNLLAHHLRVLDEAGVIRRTRSEGDRRRTYIQLVLDDPLVLRLIPPSPRAASDDQRRDRAPGRSRLTQRLVFVCTHNSARSQIAAAAWSRVSSVPAASAGTHPARRVHPRAVRVAHRHGLRLGRATTAHILDVVQPDDLVVAVCDNAYEELIFRPEPAGARAGIPDPASSDAAAAEHAHQLAKPELHWAVPDPAAADSDEAFEAAYEQITDRIDRLAQAITPTPATT